MIFDSEIIGALITGVLSVLIYFYGNKVLEKYRKDDKDRDISDRLLLIEAKLNDLLRLQDRLAIVENRCVTHHKNYDEKLINLKNTDEMAQKDLNRLSKEIEDMNYSLKQLRDSNIELAGRVDKMLALSAQRDKEQDRKIESLFKKLEK